MRSCWPGVLVLVATLAAPAPAAVAGHPGDAAAGQPGDAAAGHPGDGAAGRPGDAAAAIPAVTPGMAGGPGVLVARYGFDRGRSAPITDESGHGHTLRAVRAHGGAVRPVVHGRGTALAFPAECAGPGCPHVALQSPSAADLNPGTRDIAFGADVLLPPGQTSQGENIVQKGYSAAGSQWKLQVDGAAGRPSCVLVGDRRPAIRITHSSVSIADGRWHALQCRRVGGTLAVFVDGVGRGRVAIPAGLSVTNRRPLSIGAKGAFGDNDQFNGALDNVWVQIG